MAIDGTKIIDSDTAHDVYNEFMDLYDANVDISQIKNKIESWRDWTVDDEDFEIFITAYALALWETGNLTGDILTETQQTIANGAGVKMWLDEGMEKESKDRKIVLTKFLAKISTPRTKPRKRRNYKKIKEFLFQTDDIVIFQLQDSSYRAAVLIDIHEYRGECAYRLAATSCISSEKPTESVIKDHSIFLYQIGCGYDRETVKNMQPGIEKFWVSDDEKASHFMLGLIEYRITHPDLLKFREKFEVIGKAHIKEGFKTLGSIQYLSTFEELERIFQDIDDQPIRGFKDMAIKIEDLC